MYVDAKAEDIENWYLHRFRRLRETAFQNPFSYFRKYTQVSEAEALDYARTMWRTINKPNLLENVAPTRGRATLVAAQGPGPQGPASVTAQTLTPKGCTVLHLRLIVPADHTDEVVRLLEGTVGTAHLGC